MKLKKLIAAAAVAVATVAAASTNYLELAASQGKLAPVIEAMSQDPDLADPAEFRAALEELDRFAATGGVKCTYHYLTRCCPLATRDRLEKCAFLSERVKGDILSRCGYDRENASVCPTVRDAGYANHVLQASAAGGIGAAHARRGVLAAAVAPVRRTVRAETGTFVGEESGRKAKEILDALAAELNAPRYGNAAEILERIGIEVEWDAVRGNVLTDAEIAETRRQLFAGELFFGWTVQQRLCAALGVAAYNELVAEYNGK